MDKLHCFLDVIVSRRVTSLSNVRTNFLVAYLFRNASGFFPLLRVRNDILVNVVADPSAQLSVCLIVIRRIEGVIPGWLSPRAEFTECFLWRHNERSDDERLKVTREEKR